jgi:hypothetical protein
VEANSTGGQGSRWAVAPSDDDYGGGGGGGGGQGHIPTAHYRAKSPRRKCRMFHGAGLDDLRNTEELRN